MVTQFGRSGMRRACPRALLPVSFLYALAPCQREERWRRVRSREGGREGGREGEERWRRVGSREGRAGG